MDHSSFSMKPKVLFEIEERANWRRKSRFFFGFWLIISKRWTFRGILLSGNAHWLDFLKNVFVEEPSGVFLTEMSAMSWRNLPKVNIFLTEFSVTSTYWTSYAMGSPKLWCSVATIVLSAKVDSRESAWLAWNWGSILVELLVMGCLSL